MKVNIKQLALEFADVNGTTKKHAEEAIRELFDIIAENIEEGHEVVIPDFGKFRRKETKERQGRNPSTGEAITIAAKKSPNFLASKALKERVNV